jgi:ribonuclease VapC
MIVDTSAVIAILRGEPRAEQLADAVFAARGATMSAASYVEAAAVVDRVGDPVLSRRLDELLAVLRIELAPFDAVQASAARAAYADFGKGSGHPAGLNFGDCLTYGLAKATGQPLLYVGEDFAHTDLHSARRDGPGKRGS